MKFKKNLVAFLLLIVCFFSVLSFANFKVHGYSNGIEELQGKVQLGSYERVEQQNVLKKHLLLLSCGRFLMKMVN